MCGPKQEPHNQPWKKALTSGASAHSADHVFILAEAAINLTVTRGMGAPEARICYERVESFGQSSNAPLFSIDRQVALLPDE